MPKIYLVHAMAPSMAPIEASFSKLWPQPRLAHLLEDSLPADLKQEGRLTDAMIARFRDLGRYCVSAGADAILFSCSAFGPANSGPSGFSRTPARNFLNGYRVGSAR